MKKLYETIFYSWFLVIILVLVITVINFVKFGFSMKTIVGITIVVLGTIFIKLFKKEK